MSLKNKYIVAIGGGGFTHGTDKFLDDFVLSIKNKKKINIGFLPTASYDDKAKTQLFYKRFINSGYSLSHFNLHTSSNGFSQWMTKKDIIYVGGGNTYNMLKFWKDKNLLRIFIDAYNNGTILSGVSAGAICWFNFMLTNSINNRLQASKGLGLIKYSCTPHASSEPERVIIFEQKVKNALMPPGFAIDDGVAILFVDGKLSKVFSSRPNHSAYFITETGIKNLEE
tara:strand:+ start:860 stop:1537 length:678 start_codon:yes stop_codon:yes gene_type:complete